jgi:hypothetical protein
LLQKKNGQCEAVRLIAQFEIKWKRWGKSRKNIHWSC